MHVIVYYLSGFEFIIDLESFTFFFWRGYNILSYRHLSGTVMLNSSNNILSPSIYIEEYVYGSTENTGTLMLIFLFEIWMKTENTMMEDGLYLKRQEIKVC